MGGSISSRWLDVDKENRSFLGYYQNARVPKLLTKLSRQTPKTYPIFLFGLFTKYTEIMLAKSAPPPQIKKLAISTWKTSAPSKRFHTPTHTWILYEQDLNDIISVLEVEKKHFFFRNSSLHKTKFLLKTNKTNLGVQKSLYQTHGVYMKAQNTTQKSTN